MANYLPVLLVSVQGVPDDSSLSTQPRSQVDYLSHNWEEEDVWRSWRNMTRQKNEITNGMRLENASWRTWWKQRNKLKTVTPETLNWLKDSDVTWLYGPLHTAVDWAPPPKPKPDPTSVGKDQSAQDRLDLSYPSYKKPILKHRSISEFLTSDLPPSPLFSPADSDEEQDTAHETQLSQDLRAVFQPDVHDKQQTVPPTRPPLWHTKSDTHVIRWGSNRAFRKDSPPRIFLAEHSFPASLGHGATLADKSDLSSYFDTSTSSKCEDPLPSPNLTRRKHITFNTFVEQCIAIEKPKKGSDSEDDWSSPGQSHDDGYEEDEEDGFDDGECAIASDSESDAAEDDQEEEEEVLTMRPSPTTSTFNLGDLPTPPPPPIPAGYIPPKKRSKSKVSNSSSSTTSSSCSSAIYSSSSQLPVHQRSKPRSQSTQSHIRSPTAILRTSSLGDRESLTIAPIAPTMLKTEGTGGEWDDYSVDDTWERLGLAARPERLGPHVADRMGDDVPLELVYLPPLWSNVEVSEDSEEDVEDVCLREIDLQESPDHVYHYALNEEDVPSLLKVTPPSPPSTRKAASRATALSDPSLDLPSLPVLPIGYQVIDSPQPITIPDRSIPESQQSPYDYFEGPDLGEDFGGRRQRPVDQAQFGQPLKRYPSSSATWTAPRFAAFKSASMEETSRPSRSRSRTPSPSISLSPSRSPPGSRAPIVIPSRRQPTPDGQSSSSPSLLSPPTRGRAIRSPHNSLSPPEQSRGRSSTRTSSSFSDRERSSQASSLGGSLSPEGSGTSMGISVSGGSYVGGRRLEGDARGRERGERGRGRTERRVDSSDGGSRSGSSGHNLSLSPDPGAPAAAASLPGRRYQDKRANQEDRTSNSATDIHPRPISTVMDSIARVQSSIPSPVPEEPEREMQLDDGMDLIRPSFTPSNSPIQTFQTINNSMLPSSSAKVTASDSSTTTKPGSGNTSVFSPSQSIRVQSPPPQLAQLFDPNPVPAVSTVIAAVPHLRSSPTNVSLSTANSSSSPAMDAAESTLAKLSPNKGTERMSWDLGSSAAGAKDSENRDRTERDGGGDGLVGKLVNSASAYLGFWHGSTTSET